MHMYNVTTINEFILLGRTDVPDVCYSLLVLLAVIHLVTLVENGTILFAIGTKKKLHTPMYYFLANLSPLDMFCLPNIIPKMLENLLTEKQSISSIGCALQLYFLLALAGTEVFLFTVMAYDWSLAICFPLPYTLIMTRVHCAQLMAGCWAAGFLHCLLHMVSMFCLSFCKSHHVNQYYCDIPPLVALSCSSMYVAKMLVLVKGGILGTIIILVTFISYMYIKSTILKIWSAEGKCKAFSTCTSHILVVGLFYGTLMFTCIHPSSHQHSQGRARLLSMLSGVVTLMLNPVIYSLRNTEVKEAIKRFHSIQHVYSKHSADKKNLVSTLLRMKS